MSNTALLERPTARPPPARRLRARRRPGRGQARRRRPPPRGRAHLPAGTAPRGFALYVGIDEAKAAASGVNLGVLVDALRRTLAELAPDAETYATVALAPVGSGGRDVDVVRLALHEPSAIARTKQDEPEDEDRARRRRRRRHLAQARADRRRVGRVHLQGVRAAAVPRAARGPHDRAHRARRRRSGRARPTRRRRASARSTCTSAACAPSSAATKTSCAPCAVSATDSTATPTSRSATATARLRPTASERCSPAWCASLGHRCPTNASDTPVPRRCQWDTDDRPGGSGSRMSEPGA